MLACEQRCSQHQKVPWVLPDSADRVRPPVSADGEGDADCELLRALLLPVGVNSIEELEFVLALMPAVRLNEVDDLARQCTVVGGEDRVEAASRASDESISLASAR